MTTQELTGYVRAIVDGWKRSNYIDEKKNVSLWINRPCPYTGNITIEIRYTERIEEEPYRLYDRHDRGTITVHDPKSVRTTEKVVWNTGDGINALWDTIEKMIDRINKIEL